MEKSSRFESRASVFISALALVFSIASFYREGQDPAAPDITITPLNPRVDVRCNVGSSKWEVLALLPYRIINKGQKTTSLVELRERKKIRPVVVKSLGANPFPAWAVIFLPKSLNQTTEDALPSEVEEEFVEPARGRRTFVGLGAQLEPFVGSVDGELITGENNVLTIGFMSDLVHNNNPVEQFTLNLDFAFTHDEIMTIETVIKPEMRKGMCPEDFFGG